MSEDIQLFNVIGRYLRLAETVDISKIALMALMADLVKMAEIRNKSILFKELFESL